MNLVEWVVTHWNSVEADFQQFYGIEDPLSLPWRRFSALVSNMPPESRTVRAIADHVPDERPPWARRLARLRGEQKRPDKVITIGEYMKKGAT